MKNIEKNSIKAFIPAADNKTQLKTDVIPVSALKDKVVLDKSDYAAFCMLVAELSTVLPDGENKDYLEAMIKECE